MIKIVSWNINSVRKRMPLIEHLIKEHDPDVICMQETKAEDHNFPSFIFSGYNHQIIDGQKSYNGVAIISKFPLKNSKINKVFNNDSRAVSADINGITLTNIYVPAGGGEEPDLSPNSKYEHKLFYLDRLGELVDPNAKYKLFVGDLNVAPLEEDVWSHKQLINTVSHTEAEIIRMNKWISDYNLVDLPRLSIPKEQKLYSWWSYRNKDYRVHNRGRRLDHAYSCENLAKLVNKAYYLTEYRSYSEPSDHVPLVIEVNIL